MYDFNWNSDNIICHVESYCTRDDFNNVAKLSVNDLRPWRYSMYVDRVWPKWPTSLQFALNSICWLVIIPLPPDSNILADEHMGYHCSSSWWLKFKLDQITCPASKQVFAGGVWRINFVFMISPFTKANQFPQKLIPRLITISVSKLYYWPTLSTKTCARAISTFRIYSCMFCML